MLVGDLLRTSYNIIILILLSVVVFASTSGCLETPVVTPASVSDDVLDEYGWVQVEDVMYDSQELTVANTTLTVSTAKSVYMDERLSNEITTQIQETLADLGAESSMEVPVFSSQMTSMRIVLPAGVTLPSGPITGMIDSLMGSVTEANNIQNFSKVGSRELVLNDGSTTISNIYTGRIDTGVSSINVMGTMMLWSTSDSNVIVFAIVPDGAIDLKIGSLEQTIATVDGDQAMAEVIEMARTIE